MEENPKVNGEEIVRDENGRVVSGVLNPNGRPKGSESFTTKWRKAIGKLAEEEGKTADDIERELILVGLEKAKKGDYRFYQDIFDRVHGKPRQSIDHTTAGLPLVNEEQKKLVEKKAEDILHE